MPVDVVLWMMKYGVRVIIYGKNATKMNWKAIYLWLLVPRTTTVGSLLEGAEQDLRFSWDLATWKGFVILANPGPTVSEREGGSLSCSISHAQSTYGCYIISPSILSRLSGFFCSLAIPLYQHVTPIFRWIVSDRI